MHGMLTFSVVLIHGNAHPHTAASTQGPLDHFSWELFDHSPYNLALTLSNSHLFTSLMNWLVSQCFNNNEKLMEGVKTWFI
jgi:hypothetical protein